MCNNELLNKRVNLFIFCFFLTLNSQVDDRLKQLENVNTFTDFVQAFSQFGSDMVELAHLSGDRQNVSAVHIIW